MHLPKFRGSFVGSRCDVDIASGFAAMVVAQRGRCTWWGTCRWTRERPGTPVGGSILLVLGVRAGLARGGRRGRSPFVSYRVLGHGAIRRRPLAVLAIGGVASVGLGVR